MERRTATVPLWGVILLIVSILLSGGCAILAANAQASAADHGALATKAEMAALKDIDNAISSEILQRLAGLEAKVDLLLKER